jgi:hypothetical protein
MRRNEETRRNHHKNGADPSIVAGGRAVKQHVGAIEREGALAPIQSCKVVVGLLYDDGYCNHDSGPLDGEDHPQDERDDEAEGDMAKLIGDPGYRLGSMRPARPCCRTNRGVPAENHRPVYHRFIPSPPPD